MNSDIELIENTRPQVNSKTVFAPSAKTAILYIAIFIITIVTLNQTPNLTKKYIGLSNAYFLSFIIGFIISLITFLTLFLKNEKRVSFGNFISLTLSLIFIQSLSPPTSGSGLTLATLLTQENIIYFCIMIFIGPLLEEVAFRGCLFGSVCYFSKSFDGGVIFSMLVTSLVFSTMHAQYDAISAYITEFLFSIILTTIRINTRSLIYPIAAHTILNSFAVISLILSVAF